MRNLEELERDTKILRDNMKFMRHTLQGDQISRLFMHNSSELYPELVTEARDLFEELLRSAEALEYKHARKLHAIDELLSTFAYAKAHPKNREE